MREASCPKLGHTFRQSMRSCLLLLVGRQGAGRNSGHYPAIFQETKKTA